MGQCRFCFEIQLVLEELQDGYSIPPLPNIHQRVESRYRCALVKLAITIQGKINYMPTRREGIRDVLIL